MTKLELEHRSYFEAGFQVSVWLNETHKKLRFVRILEALTLQSNLRVLTVSPWGKLIFPGFLRGAKAWCPSCFQEWQESSRPIYEPLLWSLDPVLVCPRHEHSLYSHCPECQRTQPALMQHLRRVGYCSSCGSWLGLPPEKVRGFRVPHQQFDWQVWAINALGELLAVLPHRKAKKRLALCEYLSRLNKEEKFELARSMGLGREPLEKLKALPKRKPTLFELLKFSCYVRASLVDLLTDKLETGR